MRKSVPIIAAVNSEMVSACDTKMTSSPKYVDSNRVKHSRALRYKSRGDSTLADGCRDAGTGGGVFPESFSSPAHTSGHLVWLSKSSAPILRGSSSPENSVLS